MNLSFRRIAIAICLLLVIDAEADQVALEEMIRQAAISRGYVFPADVYTNPDLNLSDEGNKFFDSPHLSLNAQVKCSTCHLMEMASTDGIPNAAGIHGSGEGVKRFYSGAKIVPRNTLGLWGVGGKGFNTFFWDGRVDFSVQPRISQFGTKVPSVDPLVTAVHLPVVEIRETLDEDDFVRAQKQESVSGARTVYEAIMWNLVQHERALVESLSLDLDKPVGEIEFIDVARSIASFIREEFKIKPTKFEKFIRTEINFDEEQLRGAITFYGKGGCAGCHSGPYFTDLQFHTVPFPQLGFGKNGFGIDYGRYNVTFDPEDLYQFRTPSLLNVEKTGPYGHSGSIPDIRTAILGHYDPLTVQDIGDYDRLQRHEFYKYIAKSDTVNVVNFLTDKELGSLERFLQTLSFED